MYQKPDFLKVSVKINDIIANYLQTGCPQDSFAYWTFTGDTAEDCKGTDGYHEVRDTFIGLGWGDGCYSTHNP